MWGHEGEARGRRGGPCGVRVGERGAGREVGTESEGGRLPRGGHEAVGFSDTGETARSRWRESACRQAWAVRGRCEER